MNRDNFNILLATLLALALAAPGCSDEKKDPADAQADTLLDAQADRALPDLPPAADLSPDATPLQDFSFFVLGDTRSFPATFTANVTSMLALDPKAQAIFNLGDLTWSGADKEWVTEHDEVLDKVGKGKIRRDLTVWDPKFIRYVGVMGNHDAEDADWLKNWNKHLPGQKNLGYNGQDGVYFTLNHGGVLFVALDSQHTSAAQDAWLTKQLSALDPVKHRWRLAFFHHPIYPCNSRMPFAAGIPWARLFEKHGFDMVFVADSHTYERTCSIKGGKCAAGGVVYLNTSGGAAELYDVISDREATVSTDSYHCAAKGAAPGILKMGIGKWHHYTHIRVTKSTLTLKAYSHNASTKPKDMVVLSK